MKRKYNVISKKGVDVSEIDADLISQTQIDGVPDREVAISSPLKRSKRVTTFLLTDDEAEQLRSDNRVLDVELDVSENEDISVGHCQTSTHDYNRNADHNDSNLGNWGLKRHAQENLDNYNNNGTLKSGHEDLEFNLSGEGVDIVIWDTGLDARHPDFNDENGNSRVQKINWGDIYLEANNGVLDEKYNAGLFNLAHQPDIYYRDYDGHGTSCASIAAGLRFGMAKKAHIYLAKRNSSESVVVWQTLLDLLDTVMYWHDNKNNNRPTIINNSWGYITRAVHHDEVTGGRFRLNADDDYTVWSNNNFSDEFMANYAQMRINGIGLPTTHRDFYRAAMEKNLAFDTLLQEAIDSGIHVVNAAGNYSDRIVKENHPEYDNFVTATHYAGGFFQVDREVYYNRGGSPYSEDALYVGAFEDLDNSTGTKKDDITNYSGRGEAVDIYCATNCASAASSWISAPDDSFTYPDDLNFNGRYLDGTSCATPNAVGIAACHLSATPSLTPTQLKAKILSDAKSNILLERSGSWNATNPFLDSNNTIMYNRYNQNVGITATNVKIENATFGAFKHETIARTQSYFELNESGVNALRPQGYNKGSFDNEDVPTIYKNGKLLSLYNVYNGNQTYTYIFKFDGDAYNGGWEWIEITRSTSFRSFNQDLLRLKRKDAKWDHVKKEFSWVVDNESRLKAPLFGQQKLVIN